MENTPETNRNTNLIIGLAISGAIGYFTWWPIGLILAASVIYSIAKGEDKNPIAPSPKQTTSKPISHSAKQTTDPSNHTWKSTGCYGFQIVGESFYQDNLKILAGDHGDRDPKEEYTATIIPDDRNEHDDKAVRVDINGKTVGHLSRDDARSFRKRLAAKKLTGQTTTCAAKINGGWKKKDGTRATYAVELDMKPFM